MTTSTISFENNTYSFNVLASNGSGNIIDTYEVSIEENFNNEFEVVSFSIGTAPIYKTLKTEDDANIYAMKLIYKLKKTI